MVHYSMFNKGSQRGTKIKIKEMRTCHGYYIRLDCAKKLFGKHEYIPVSISHLTYNGGRADTNGRMGGDEVVEVRLMKMINVTVIERFGTKSRPS
jgi:hypothetical protein